jgi:hypothetical protein
MLILIEDAKAKVECDNKHQEKVMGNQGLGVMNKNGERLVNLCEGYSLVIGGTLFKHKEIH